MASSTDATGGAASGTSPASASTPTTTPTIRTPDQRLRVFISSTLGELAEERAAARAAVDDLRLLPVMFELGARPHPPRDLYRAYLAQSHVFVGIYWQRYGWVAPDMEISGLEDEYLLATEHPKLIYIKSPAPDRDPALERLLDRIRDDNNASYRSFTTADELGELLENDLAVLLTERFEATNIGNGDGGAAAADVSEERADTVPVDTSPLVGRDDELRELFAMFACEGTRLVTLTGPGGCGKTRLALRIAELAQEELGQRVCFVDLSSVRDPSRVLTTIASAVGVRDVGSRRLVDAITSLLRDAPRTLVIDNFEHVIDAAADIAEILSATSEVPVLVTSREALRLRWEQEYPVRPLPVPAKGQSLDPDELGTVAAVELFVERAQRVQAAFALTDANAGVVAEICRRLDGLPLAIELAAARMRVLSADELLARLEHRLDTLRGGWLDAPDRHRALREAIGWSHDLLGRDEQRVFRRMAAFAGGCSLEAVEAVCREATNDDVLEILASLVDKSLVVSAVDPITMHTRFSLLETVREYGLERLAEAGEEGEVRSRHLAYHHAMGEQAAEKMRGPETAAWLDLLEREHDNLRAALDFATPSGNARLGLELATNLRLFWDIRGHYREAIDRYRALIDAMPDEPSVLRGRARDAVGWLTGMTGDYVAALEWLRAGCDEVRATGDPVALARSIAEQAIVMCNLFLVDEAEALLREGWPLAEASGDPYLVAFARFGQSQVALLQGDLDTAVHGFEEVLALARSIDEPWSLAWTLAVTGAWHVATSDSSRARTELTECLALRSRLRDDRGTADCLALLACLASAEGDFEWAARLHGAAEIGQEANAVTIWPFFEPLHVESVQRLRGALGASQLDELWRTGRSTPMYEIVTEALDDGRYART